MAEYVYTVTYEEMLNEIEQRNNQDNIEQPNKQDDKVAELIAEGWNASVEYNPADKTFKITMRK